MPTGQQIVNVAVGKLGARPAANTDVNANESADALAVANSMLDSWRIEHLNVYHIIQQSHTWPSGEATRSIGSGGQFNVARPDKIETAFSINSTAVTTEMYVETDRAIYDRIPDKTATSNVPQLLIYDMAYPLGFLTLYPIPSEALTVLLNVWQVLQSFASLTTNLLLPPGYQFAIENNLAMALAPYYPNTTAVQLIAPLARSSKAAIQRLNSNIGVLRLDSGIARGRRPNILTGV